MNVSGKTLRQHNNFISASLSENDRNVLEKRVIIAEKYNKVLIHPFHEKEVEELSNLSSGLTYVGYDVTLDTIRKANNSPGLRDRFYETNVIEDIDDLYESTYTSAHLDPSHWDYKRLNFVIETRKSRLSDKLKSLYSDMWQDPVSCTVLNSKEFCIANIREYVSIPSNMLVEVRDKSSLARLGIQVQNTVAEPGWRGYLTVEIVNHGHLPILLYSGMPIAQLQFSMTDTDCEVYTGKYQDQEKSPVGTR